MDLKIPLTFGETVLIMWLNTS